MFLPKIANKIVLIFLLLAVFFVSLPLSYVLAAPQVISPQQGTDGKDYLLIPVSDLQQQTQTSIATLSANPEGGQVLGILSVFGDIWGAIKNFGEALGDVAKCVTNPVKCGLEGMKAIFDFGAVAFEKFILNQFGGEATDCFIVEDRTDSPAHCKEIDAAIVAYQRGEPVTLNPSSFGILGAVAQTTTTALALPIPITTNTYLASINPFSEAQATQGTDTLGDSKIVLEIWTKVRDAAYILLVVVTVVIGFMIMFRIPIGPRNVVTIQNSLPKIAIAMLLITFSYLLAGLMLDLTRFVGDILQSLLPPISTSGFAQGAASLLGVLLIFLLALFAIVSVFFTPVIGAVVAIGVLLLFVFALVIMFIMITFKLVSRLAIFLILVMFAPIFFLFGAFPRGELAITYWFKRSIAALLAIPATGFVISLALVIGSSGVHGIDLGFADDSLPSLGFIGPSLDLFSWAFAAPVIGLVLLSFAVKTPNIVDELFGIKDLGSRVGGIGAVFGAPGKGFQTAGNIGRNVKGIGTLRKGAATLLRGGGWKSGGQSSQNVPPGIPKSSLSPTWQSWGDKNKLFKTPAGGGPEVTAGGRIEYPQPEQEGGMAGARRAAARATGWITGQKAPPKKITIVSPKQSARERSSIDESARKSGGPGAGTGPDDEND